MKKRIISIIIALAMLLAMIPTSAYAANQDFYVKYKGIKYEKQYHLIKMPGSKSVKGVADFLTKVKQSCRDSLDDMWDESVQDRSEYCDEVWNKLEGYYQEELDRINNCTNWNEMMVPFLGIFYIYIPGDALMKMTLLSVYTTDLYASPADLPKLQEQMELSVNQFAQNIDRDDYNDYYLSIIDSAVDTYNEGKGSVTNLEEFIDLEMELSFVIGDIDDSDDDDYWDDDDDSDEDDEEYEPPFTHTISGLPYDREELGYLATKEDIEAFRENAKLYVENYMIRQLAASRYTGDMTKINARYEAFEKSLMTKMSMADINSLAVNTVNMMVDITGVKYEPNSEAGAYEVINKINAYLGDAYEDEYSDDRLWEIWELLDYVEDIIYEANFAVEYYDLFDQFKEAFDKIPKKDVELRNLKAKYVKKFNSFKGNAKYDQKKLKPIVDAAVKAINAAKDIYECDSIYEKYIDKVNGTIKKFKITTSKKGKGKVTPTKTVKYGSSATISIIPDAGYKISQVKIDGKSQKLKNSYTFKNVTKNHTLSVTFKK